MKCGGGGGTTTADPARRPPRSPPPTLLRSKQRHAAAASYHAPSCMLRSAPVGDREKDLCWLAARPAPHYGLEETQKMASKEGQAASAAGAAGAESAAQSRLYYENPTLRKTVRK